MDELYVKMCKEAEELQRDMDEEDTHLFHYISIRATEEGLKKYEYVDPWDQVDHSRDPQELTWLPRQEDLQKIALEILSKKAITPFFLISHFWDYFNGMDLKLLYKLNDTHNYTMIWLCFVMYECFNKTWNFKQEKWEELI